LNFSLHHHNCFTALFPGPPGSASARREPLDFVVQGKINRGRHTDHPAGCHSIQTNQCPPLPSLPFFTGRMPFLPPNQLCQSTECNWCIRIREKTLEFSSTVLPAPSNLSNIQHLSDSVILESGLILHIYKDHGERAADRWTDTTTANTHAS